MAAMGVLSNCRRISCKALAMLRLEPFLCILCVNQWWIVLPIYAAMVGPCADIDQECIGFQPKLSSEVPDGARAGSPRGNTSAPLHFIHNLMYPRFAPPGHQPLVKFNQVRMIQSFVKDKSLFRRVAVRYTRSQASTKSFSPIGLRNVASSSIVLCTRAES